MTYDSSPVSEQSAARSRTCGGIAVLDSRRDASKFTLGIPFYARSVRKPRGCEDIRRVASGHDENVRRIGESHRDSRSILCPTFSEKVRLAREHGFAGVMAWELGQDVTPATREDSVARAIADEVGKTDARDELCAK